MKKGKYDTTLYKLRWIDSTLMENFTNKKALKQAYADEGISISYVTNDGSWYDYLAEHRINVLNDREAIEYVASYDFGGRDVDGFTLYKRGKEICTEDDFSDKRYCHLCGAVEEQKWCTNKSCYEFTRYL